MLIALLAPLLLMVVPVHDRELHGVTRPVTLPPLTKENWFSGYFQKGMESFFRFHVGLRRAGVRTAAQWQYWMGVQRRDVIVGEQNELMGREYIDAFYGRDFIGSDSVEKSVKAIALMRDSLQAHGIQFFVVIAPNKSRLYASRIPIFLQDTLTDRTNYDQYLSALSRAHIPVVNFQSWFAAIDPMAPFPLFSNLGLHWSNYAAVICADSMLGFMAGILNKNLNRAKFSGVTSSIKPIGTDQDLLQLMNLWWPIPVNRPLGYVQTQLDTSKLCYRPSVLVVADSYYWNVIYSGIPAAYFSPKSVYYYYNSTIHSNDGSVVSTRNDHLKERVLQQDVVIYLYAEPNLIHFGNNFHNRVMNAFSNVDSPTRYE